jgi:integrase
MKRRRHQDGQLYEASGSFYIRYWTTKNNQRVRVSHLLCEKNDEHRNVKSRAVRDLAAAHMQTINTVSGQDSKPVLIRDYYTNVYLPFVKRHLKPSTVDGYEEVWRNHLKDHFADRTLAEHEPVHGNRLLNEKLDGGYGKRTLAHIRSLASGIFTHAINDGLLRVNPWSAVKTKVKPPEPKPTQDYTLTELMDIVNNKLTRIDAQLIVCLAGLMGLRPSEIIGLDWQDVNLKAGRLRVHQAYVRGHLGTTKTGVDVTLPMLKMVMGLFKAWYEQSGEPSTGWVFPNQSRKDPINIRDYVVAVLRPNIPAWKSLYAFRRGAGSILTELTGDPIAAQQMLRHLDLTTTIRHYIKTKRAALMEGVQKLDERLALSK